MKLPTFFSAAHMMIASMSKNVQKVSMKSPRTMLVPGESVVRTLSEPVAAAPPFSLSAFLVSEERDVPGNMQLTSPAAAMPAAY